MNNNDLEFSGLYPRIPLEKRGKGKIIIQNDADPERKAKFIDETHDLHARIEYARRVNLALAAVRAYLKHEGKSKRELAKDLHMAEQQVGQILKPGRVLEGETLIKLMMVTGVNVFEMMAELEPDNRAEKRRPKDAVVSVVLQQAAYRQVASFAYRNEPNEGIDPVTQRYTGRVIANTYRSDTPYCGTA